MVHKLAQCKIKINGSPISAEMLAAVTEVVVDSSLYLPDMFTILMGDPKLKWCDDATLDVGKTVAIDMEFTDEAGTTKSGTLMDGEITAIEPRFQAEDETMLVIRGYTKGHRLHRGKKTRTFLSQTDSGVVGTLAGEAGLSADSDATTITYDWMIQNNQTNMEFLKARAKRLGYKVWMSEGKLHFKKGESTAGTGPTLTFGKNLLRFQPVLAASHQADTITVKGWDYKAKAALTGSSTPNSALNQGGVTETGGAKASGAFGAAEAVLTDRPVFTADEATAIATGLSNDITRGFVEAEGSCTGEPGVKAGWAVTVEKVGTRFSGTYVVTSATHVWSHTSYVTSFTVSGRRPNTLMNLVRAGDGDPEAEGLVRGVVTGVVTNLVDPDNLGRVKVKYTWLGEIESWWVRIATPMAGSSRGFMWLPEVNDEVLLAFEHGDPHRPYIIGALWSSVDQPPDTNANVQSDGKVNKRIVKTRAGHLITLDDTQGKEQINITTKSGHQITLDDTSGSEKISVIDKTKNNKMIIDSAQNSLQVLMNGDMTFDSKGKIILKAATGVEMSSQAAFKITGQTGVEVASQTTLKMSSQTSTELASSLATTVKGTQVSVQGSAMTEVKGALVKIN